MPDIKEKLVELLDDTSVIFQPETVEYLADHLIAKGVTIPTWYRTEERLPETSGFYLTITQSGRTAALHYSCKNKAFNAFDDISAENEIFCTHWMQIPPPPEGD